MAEEEKKLSLEQVLDLRRKVLEGQEVTREELRAAIAFLREDRFSAAMSKGKKEKKVSVAVDLDKLLNL